MKKYTLAEILAEVKAEGKTGRVVRTRAQIKAEFEAQRSELCKQFANAWNAAK
jgi:hypothetical protein